MKNVASDASRPGWGSPGEGWLGALVAAAAVDPGPIFTFEIEVRKKLNLKPDFARGLCNRTEWAEKAAALRGFGNRS